MEDIIGYIQTQVNGVEERKVSRCCILPGKPAAMGGMAGIERLPGLPDERKHAGLSRRIT